ncbi:hypothetical protein [Hoeflea poritis]|uniref:Uncharacterized protein n=1 Tax=Hoeflea poritis TaxID=2993659 RepID=A0ABT4VH26_9HYPH|nr:hypothetical protein [Hoeflea poritis]MDA4844002.1 hypothetical protein [Hoeflea poritis]
MSRRSRQWRIPRTRETILQERTDNILQSAYRDGEILRKYRQGFSTGNEQFDAFIKRVDPLLSTNQFLEAVDRALTESQLLWRPNEMLRQQLFRLEQDLHKNVGENLSNEHRERIKDLAQEALRKGVEGRKLYEKTSRPKQVKTSRIGTVNAERKNRLADERRGTQNPPSTLRMRPEIHPLLSGQLKPGDVRGGRLSPNMLRMLMGGTVPRVKGVTRLVDIAKQPLDPID